jgi:hypothetical protein
VLAASLVVVGCERMILLITRRPSVLARAG